MNTDKIQSGKSEILLPIILANCVSLFYLVLQY